jgi:hypothetical protein
MTLQVIGAGLGRTGTASLKLALEQVLDGRCYHMREVTDDLEQDVFWLGAVRGEEHDLAGFLAPYVATVDWPACAFWSELAAACPDALILLSTRESPERWWASMEKTIVPTVKQRAQDSDPLLVRHGRMVRELFERRFCARWDDPAAAMSAYEHHNEDVRRRAEPARLLEWQPGDGWEPICGALGVAVPDSPFPHENSAAEFLARVRRR